MIVQGIEIQENLDVLVIVGPTASGKTELAINLAKALNGEIISGDAYQVYQKMDIGTAKVTEDEMAGIPHYLIDIIDYKEEYNVAKFQKMAREKIADIKARGKLPIIAGGTGLYIKAALFHYEFLENEKLNETRLKVEQYTLEQMQQYCQEHQIELNNSEINNPKHLVNIIAKDMLKITSDKNGDKPFYDKFQIISLTMDREVLYERINQRVEIMFDQGLLEEVKQFEPNYLSQLAIGYKEIHQNIDDIEYAKKMIKQNSRNFAKRQITWFSNQMNTQEYIRDGKDGSYTRIN